MFEKDDKVLVTGSAGFIGFHLCRKLLKLGVKVVGVDNFNTYYDAMLKRERIKQIVKNPSFKNYEMDIASRDNVDWIFKKEKPNYVCNLAAYAGVPYSLTNPEPYILTNCYGFTNIINAAKNYNVKNFVYASSSSVYGNSVPPYKETDDTEHPLNTYAATKKFNEMEAYAFNKNFGIKTTGLRFFTVYGPWGRPDMVVYKWVKAVYNGTKVTINNNGNMYRDFTYIDDIINGFMLAFERPIDYKVYNLGRGEMVQLKELLDIIEKTIGREAKKEYVDLPKGEIVESLSDLTMVKRELDYNPKFSIEDGVREFVNWYKVYNKIK